MGGIRSEGLLYPPFVREHLLRSRLFRSAIAKAK